MSCTSLTDTLLLHIASTWPANATELSRRLSLPKDVIHQEINALMESETIYLHAGTLRAWNPAEPLTRTPAETLQEVFDQALAEIGSGSNTRTTTLTALVEAGCTDPLLFEKLLTTTEQHPGDPAAEAALRTLARALEMRDEALTVQRATRAAGLGMTHRVLSLTDPLMGHDDPEIATAATLLAAGAHLQENRCERALTLYEHLGPTRVGEQGAWAVTAALGHGDRASAERWCEAMADTGLSNLAAGLHDLAAGLDASVRGGADALDLLARSAHTLTPVSHDALLPDTPAALAALLAMSRGEPATADALLTRALDTGLGAEVGAIRHTLLRAWALMAQGNHGEAEQLSTTITTPEQLGERDRFVHSALTAALARRRSDTSGMRAAWHTLRSASFGHRTTLFDLLPLGEIMVVAARVKDAERVRALSHEATQLLERLGNPTAWAAPFHWYGVQAAFQSDDPALLKPHASALAHAGTENAYAAVLADAGNTWLAMLRRDTDFSTVEHSVHALARYGHGWDAAKLAGQAALQHPEREGALAMMQLARDISKEHTPSGETSATFQARNSTVQLTARELEVSRLVLDGQGYRAIGEQLFISPKTVEHHVARIRSRLGAQSRAELLEQLHDLISVHHPS